MCPLSILPQELIDTIIDHIPHADTATLKHSSSVSHAFLTPSRTRLFHSFTFRITYYNTPFPRTRALLTLLTSNPSLALHVRNLTIILHDWQPASSQQDHHLPKLLRMMSRLHSFTLEHDPTHPNPSPIPIALSTAVRNVLRLPTLHTARFVRLCPCRFAYDQIADLPHLRHLEFVGNFHAVRCTHEAVSVPNVRRRLVEDVGGGGARLETLAVGGLGVEAFVRGLLASPGATFSRLRELRISGWRHDVFDSAWEVMKLAAGTLETVVFCWPYGRSYRPPLSDPLGPIDLTQLPALRTVIFYLPHVWFQGDPVCLWYPWLSSLFSCSGLPRTLTQLALALETDFDDEWQVGCHGLDGAGRSLVEIQLDKLIDEGLPKDAYPRLERVHVELLLREQKEVDGNMNEVSKSAPKWFPALERRGLLTAGVSLVDAGPVGRFEGLLSPI